MKLAKRSYGSCAIASVSFFWSNFIYKLLKTEVVWITNIEFEDFFFFKNNNNIGQVDRAVDRPIGAVDRPVDPPWHMRACFHVVGVTCVHAVGWSDVERSDAEEMQCGF